MKELLKEISIIAINLNNVAFTDEQNKLEWLGSDPALPEEIESAQRRLGIEFPDDYKKFLQFTNGFFTPCDSTEPTFETVTNVDYLKNVDPYLLEVWNHGVLIDVSEQLNEAIVVGGLKDEQYFFLIPAYGTKKKWQYWKFANWIPGEHRFESLEIYFTSVLDFMKSLSEKTNLSR